MTMHRTPALRLARRLVTALPGLVAGLTMACSEDTADSNASTALDEATIAAACDHFDYGEEEAITAGADLAGAEHAHPHERLVVSLPEGADGHAGYLHVHAEGGSETYLLFSDVVPVEASDSTGAAIAALGQGDATAGCSKAALVLHYALPADGLILKIGPTEKHSFTLISHVLGASTDAETDAHVHESEPESDAHVHEESDAALEADAHVHTH